MARHTVEGQPVERKLAAILSADVVGYSRLMGEDEEGTLARLKAHRSEVIDPTVAAHHGRIIKLMGDGVLVEFASVVDAVHCAAAIQRAMAERNRDLPVRERLELRIGVNLGDVIVEGDDLYGDGVNVAARLQALAEPGGILVSGTSFDHAKHKVDVGFRFLGQQVVKNIADPVRVYRVLLGRESAGRVLGEIRTRRSRWFLSVAGAATVLVLGLLILGAWFALGGWPGQRPATTHNAELSEQRPSVAVLPFSNLSGNSEDEYFADGMTNDLITDLSKISGLMVIARNSSFTYKGRSLRAKDAASDLGVRYLLEGSIRRAGGRIRINVQLTDSTTDGHVWADRYDRDYADIFAVQDEVIGHIVAALALKLTTSEQVRLARPPTNNLEAYDFYLRAEQAVNTGDHVMLPTAFSLYEKATALDPGFADAYAAYAWAATQVLRGGFDATFPAPWARKLAYEMAGRALAANAQIPMAYSVLAVLQLLDRRYDEAIASAQQAVSLGPSDSDAHVALALVLACAGKPGAAVMAIETALRLNPKPPPVDRSVAGRVFFLNREYTRAIQSLEPAHTPQSDPDILWVLAAAYAQAGQLEKARSVVIEMLRSYPSNNVQFYRLLQEHHRREEDLALWIEAMRRAGMPEWPYDYRGDAQARLSEDEIRALAFGHVWQGHLEGGLPALLQIEAGGQTAFRTPSTILTGTARIERNMLCERNETVTLGRARCGHVYRRVTSSADRDAEYTFVSADKIFHFSVTK